MKYIQIIILFLIFSCTNNNSKSIEKGLDLQKIDTLTYKYNGFNYGLKLDLLSNGYFISENYIFSCFGGGERKKVYGTYKMDNQNLTLNPERIELIEYPEDLTSNAKTTKIKYGTNSLKIKTKFQMVTWENNQYLLSEHFDFQWNAEEENDYIRFANCLNNGLEPEISGVYLANKTNDTITSKFDVKQIPEKWQRFFLNEPVSAKIKSIKRIEDPKNEARITWLIELDKGEKDRMNNRLTLKTKDETFFIEIDSVLNNKSFGIINLHNFTPKKFLIGTELRTKWE